MCREIRWQVGVAGWSGGVLGPGKVCSVPSEFPFLPPFVFLTRPRGDWCITRCCTIACGGLLAVVSGVYEKRGGVSLPGYMPPPIEWFRVCVFASCSSVFF